MGRSCFLNLLLLLLLLSFSHGFGRKVMATAENGESSLKIEESGGEKSREMIEVMDYQDPGPNTNPKTGFLLSPPPAQGPGPN